MYESVLPIELYSREISINSDITEGRLALPFIKHQFPIAMAKVHPLHEMAVNFGLVSNRYERKRGPKPFFSAEGKVAQMFLKMHTGLSAPKLMEH